MKTNPITPTKELEEQLIGKNVHSVYTLCLECHSWGVNLPLNHQCGNCNSNDTVTYYDIETVSQAILQERNRIITIIKENRISPHLPVGMEPNLDEQIWNNAINNTLKALENER